MNEEDRHPLPNEDIDRKRVDNQDGVRPFPPKLKRLDSESVPAWLRRIYATLRIAGVLSSATVVGSFITPDGGVKLFVEEPRPAHVVHLPDVSEEELLQKNENSLPSEIDPRVASFSEMLKDLEEKWGFNVAQGTRKKFPWAVERFEVMPEIVLVNFKGWGEQADELAVKAQEVVSSLNFEGQDPDRVAQIRYILNIIAEYAPHLLIGISDLELSTSLRAVSEFRLYDGVRTESIGEYTGIVGDIKIADDLDGEKLARVIFHELVHLFHDRTTLLRGYLDLSKTSDYYQTLYTNADVILSRFTALSQEDLLTPETRAVFDGKPLFSVLFNRDWATESVKLITFAEKSHPEILELLDPSLIMTDQAVANQFYSLILHALFTDLAADRNNVRSDISLVSIAQKRIEDVLHLLVDVQTTTEISADGTLIEGIASSDITSDTLRKETSRALVEIYHGDGSSDNYNELIKALSSLN
jgi:hypothetical protein